MAKMEPGTYQCKTTQATIYEAPSGAVMCRIGLDLGLTGGICLIQKDGTMSERGFKDAAAILGIPMPWDWALWEREPSEWAGHDVDAVIETVQGEKGEFSSVKYLNPPGGGSAAMPKADAKTLAAKYGAKTRALFGGVPAATVAGMKPASQLPPPARRPPPPAPAPKPAGPVSTVEAVWAAFCEAHPGQPEDVLFPSWDEAVRGATGKAQADVTPEEWGAMLATFDNLQF